MLKFIQKLFDTGGAQIGSNSHYLSIGTDGSLGDVGTQTHDLNNVDITTLTVGTLDGVTAATVTTLTATNLGNTKVRHMYFRPYDFKTSGSISLSTADSTWHGLVYSTACPASTTDSYIYTQFPIPADAAVGTAMNLYLYSQKTTTGASITHYIVSASYLGSGEVVAPAGASTTFNYQFTNASVANTVEKVSVGNFGTGFAVGDLVKAKIGYYSSGASNSSTNDTIWLAQVDYSSTVLA